MPELSASRAALLALRRDRRIIEEGHRFLDEKRVALAHEVLRRMKEYEEQQRAFAQKAEAARQALGAAVGRHGLEGLQVYPPDALGEARVERGELLFLGLRLVAEAKIALAAGEEDPKSPLAPFRSAEGKRCAAAFRALAEDAAMLSAAVANLLRLMAEYRRTERRVRALENIVLPEMKQDERRFETALEELDQEEVMRSRLFAVEDLVRTS